MRKYLLVLCPILLLGTSASANVCSSSATLADYLSSGFSCTIQGVTFSNFNYYSPTGAVQPSDVQVSTVVDGSNIGFIFMGDFSAFPSASSDALISYNVSAAGMTGDTATLLNSSASGTGALAAVAEGICTGTVAASGACSPATSAYDLVVDKDGSGGGSLTQSVLFATPADLQSIVKNVVAVGSATGGASVSQFENTVQIPGGGGTPGGGPTPEPIPLLTLGSGLILTSMLLRHRRHKA